MKDNIFENLTDEEQTLAWMYMIFNRDEIIEKMEKWAKEAEKRGMTLTEYLESISPVEVLANTPSVQPKQKTGEWILHEKDGSYWVECSVCHSERGYVNYVSRFCPDCGTKMKKDDDTTKE